jgi:putative peptidoglycan lipid II flippase
MWRASAVVGGWTLASRLLGFARDILIAAFLGSGPVADAFFVALKLPNLFRRLFGEGAFNAAFVPAFARAAAESRPAARALSGEVAGVMLLVLGLLVIAGEVAMPWLMRGFAPGFVATPARFALAVTLTRITFPYLLLICLAALLSGVLNGVGRFAVAAATPVLFNLVCIAALLALRHVLPTAGHALAFGVLAAGIVQLAWLSIACARAGLHPHLTALRPTVSPGLRQVLRRMIPGLIGAGVTQLNLTVGIIIASLLPAGTVSVLYYADRVNQLPLGTIGVALGTTLLPALARDLALNNEPAAAARLNHAIALAFAIALPAATALVLLSHPIIAVLFGRGAFSPAAAAASGVALAIYAIGLPGTVLAKLLAPACFARGDTATPVLVGGAAVAFNLLLSLSLMHALGFLAPALGTSVAALLNAALLALLLWRRGILRPDAALTSRVLRVLAATAVMAAGLLLLAPACRTLLSTPGLVRWCALAALVAAGLIAYAATAHALGVLNLRQLRAALRASEGPL